MKEDKGKEGRGKEKSEDGMESRNESVGNERIRRKLKEKERRKKEEK